MLQTIATPPRGARPHVVAITAAAAEEGKTAIALGLARAAARAGWRTVLIDGDLTRAPSARSLGYRSGRLGLIDALRGAAPLSRCFLKDPRSPLLLLSNFTSIANGYSVLSSQPMAKLIAHLRGSTDLVIVDATPLSALNESHALLRLSDAVVLAADPRRMSDAHLRRASETLAVIGAPSPGIVIAG
jgi:Mrp family chromosome partitioning ATPase